MSNFESGNHRPANSSANLFWGLSARRSSNLLAAGALAALLVMPLPLRAQTVGSSAASPMGQMPQLAVGQEYQLTPDPNNPDNPPQFQPVPDGDSGDSSMNSDDNDNNSDDNADNGDNDQNQNDDDNTDNAASDDNSPPPSPNSN
jgi:hypothetical protein